MYQGAVARWLHASIGVSLEKSEPFAFYPPFPSLSLVCVQPTAFSRPGLFDGAYVLTQLQAAGIPALLALRGHGWPESISHADFIRHFRLWLPGKWKHAPSPQSNAASPSHGSHDDPVATQSRLRVLSILARADGRHVPSTAVAASANTLLRPGQWCLGRTRVYLKPGALETLEARRAADVAKADKTVRRFLSWAVDRCRFRRMRRAIISIQVCAGGSFLATYLLLIPLLYVNFQARARGAQGRVEGRNVAEARARELQSALKGVLSLLRSVSDQLASIAAGLVQRDDVAPADREVAAKLHAHGRALVLRGQVRMRFQ
jgi:hypothetical protein